MGTHSPSPTRSHTTAHTPKHGPSLPQPQCGLMPPAKFFLFHRAFIYIHFPVLYEPSTPAEEKNPAKLPPQRCSKPLFIAFFNFSHKRPMLAFTAESGYTLAFANRIAHSGLHGETGVFWMGALLLPSERFARFGNPAWPGGRTANFAAFGSWSETLLKNAESLRDSDALMRVAVPRRRGPAGLRDLFATWWCCCFFTLCAVLSERARWGWYHYHRRALRAAETPDGRLSKWFICRFPGSLSTIPCAVTFSANMQISLSVISVANAFALWYDKSHKSGLFGDEGEPE